jgi:hypothetical protein
MAATLAQLAQRLDDLNRIRASGVGEVTSDGETIRYRSIAEIDRAIETVTAQLNRASGTRAKPRRINMMHGGKGL